MLSGLFSWGVNGQSQPWVQALLYHFTVVFFHAAAAPVDLAVFHSKAFERELMDSMLDI